MGAMRKPGTIVAGAVVLLLTFAGCGSDSDSGTSTTTTARERTCAAKARLERSVRALSDGSLLSEGKDSIVDAFQAVQRDLDDLDEAVRADLKPQVQDVQDALEALKTDVGQLDDGSVTETVAQVGRDITAVATAVGTLEDSLRDRCPG
jgi:hypothetical protein